MIVSNYFRTIFSRNCTSYQIIFCVFFIFSTPGTECAAGSPGIRKFTSPWSPGVINGWKSVRNWGGKKKLLYRSFFTPVITGFLGPPWKVVYILNPKAFFFSKFGFRSLPGRMLLAEAKDNHKASLLSWTSEWRLFIMTVVHRECAGFQNYEMMDCLCLWSVLSWRSQNGQQENCDIVKKLEIYTS